MALHFTWDGPIIDTNFVARPNGSFHYPIIVPPSTKGRHIIGIYGSSFTPKNIVPDIEFEVTPSIKLTPSDLINSRDLTVEGYGFNARESVSFSYDKSNTGVSATTDTIGNFTATFQAPISPSKEHQVTATGSKGALAQASYTSIVNGSRQHHNFFSPDPALKSRLLIRCLTLCSDVFKYIGGVFDTFSSPSKKPMILVNSHELGSQRRSIGLKYTLQISKTQDFSNIVFSQDGIQTIHLT